MIDYLQLFDFIRARHPGYVFGFGVEALDETDEKMPIPADFIEMYKGESVVLVPYVAKDKSRNNALSSKVCVVLTENDEAYKQWICDTIIDAVDQMVFKLT